MAKAHTQFDKVKIHTAKCDTCDKNNKEILYRCKICTRQICTPCMVNDATKGSHLMNNGEGGRRLMPTAPLSPGFATVNIPSEIAPVQQTSELVIQSSLSKYRRRNARQIIDESEEEEEEEEPLMKESAVKLGKRPAKRTKRDSTSAGKRRAQRIKFTRVTRAAAKATEHIDSAVDFLLALSSSAQSPTQEAEVNASDERGLLLLAEAAAFTETSGMENTDEQDAQPQSPLFFEEEPILELLEARHNESGSDIGAVSTESSKPPANVSGIEGKQSSATMYSLPLELVGMIHSSGRATTTRNPLPLRELYLSNLKFKDHSGRQRYLLR